MTDEEIEFAKKVNVDKAIKKVALPIGIILLSILTYIIPIIIFGDFDFGIIFEVASLIFLLMARLYMEQYDEVRSKRFIICAMVAIGWIIIYDTIVMISYIIDYEDIAEVSYSYFCGECLSISYLVLLYKINQDLSKADNPIKYKESTDWFYERYENEGDKKEEI